MKFIRTFIIFTFIAMLASCYSTLKVRVDSLDMNKMHQSPQFRQQQMQSELEGYNTQLRSGYFDNLQKLVSDSVRSSFKQDTSFDQSLVDTIMQQIDPLINKNVNQFKNKTADVRDALQSLLTTYNTSIKALYDTAYAQYVAQKQQLINYLRTLHKAAGVDDREVLQRFDSFVSNLQQSISPKGIYGNAITDDGMASFVAKAPDEFWKKYKSSFYKDEANFNKSTIDARMNTTRIHTFIGNSDIAIKMDGPGNFVIKGVRLDADQAFRTSFKVLSQGIQYFAATQGLPGAGQATDATSSALSIPELKNAESNKQQAVLLENQYTQLTNTFLKIIDTYKDDLASPNATKRKAAIAAVKNAYKYYKSQLVTQ